jgi:hypothetical protein
MPPLRAVRVRGDRAAPPVLSSAPTVACEANSTPLMKTYGFPRALRGSPFPMASKKQNETTRVRRRTPGKLMKTCVFFQI